MVIDGVTLYFIELILPYFGAALLVDVIILILVKRSKRTYRLHVTRPTHDKIHTLFRRFTSKGHQQEAQDPVTVHLPQHSSALEIL